MPYFIGPECIDTMDRSCVEECPVDCIYEGRRKLYINPKECIDCGACEPACPVAAVVLDTAAPDSAWRLDNARFFDQTLPGRARPLSVPGGAMVTGVIGFDTPAVISHEV
jgi:NAD-dependent dihydropyrimidine dehydrogenase PreA subunit